MTTICRTVFSDERPELSAAGRARFSEWIAGKRIEIDPPALLKRRISRSSAPSGTARSTPASASKAVSQECSAYAARPPPAPR